MEAITLKDKQMGVIRSISTDVHVHIHTHTHTHTPTVNTHTEYMYAVWLTINAVQKSMCNEWRLEIPGRN